jgi:hypothetical protein
MVEGALFVYVDEVAGPARLRRVEGDIPQPNEILYVVEYLIGSGNLFGELPLVDHPAAAEEREHEHLAEQGGSGVHLDGVQGVKELNLVELEY